MNLLTIRREDFHIGRHGRINFVRIVVEIELHSRSARAGTIPGNRYHRVRLAQNLIVALPQLDGEVDLRAGAVDDALIEIGKVDEHAHATDFGLPEKILLGIWSEIVRHAPRDLVRDHDKGRLKLDRPNICTFLWGG